MAGAADPAQDDTVRGWDQGRSGRTGTGQGWSGKVENHGRSPAAMDGPTLSLYDRPRSRGGGALAALAPASRALVLWSGGVDSTYTLLRLLRDGTDAVFSHHVRIERGDGADAGARGALEEAAIARLRPALAEAGRTFVHTASRVDLGATGTPGGEAGVLAFLAAHAAMAHRFTPFDRVLVGVNADLDPGWAPGSAACALRRARLAAALRAAWGCDEVPQVYLWEPRPTKAAMWSYLGPALAPLTVSCLHPRRDQAAGAPEACGVCVRCVWRCRVARDAPVRGVLPDAAAESSPPPFRHLVRALSRTQEPGDPAGASDPPGP
jgi:7-cyano-7-deazaguanine synthase in queuosine biosynthesis